MKIVSRIYKILLKWATEQDTVKNCTLKWAQNFNHEISMEAWEFLWKRTKLSTSVRIQENNIKMLYHWYMIPNKISMMYKNTSNLCWKCNTHEGSFFHSWWSCTKLKKFWSDVHHEDSIILNQTVPKPPEILLLGLNFEVFSPIDRTILWYATTAARLLLAQN